MGLGPTDMTFSHTAWSDTECARTFGGGRLPWADLEAERAYARIGPLWDIWYVITGDEISRASWQARPIGAGTAVISVASSEELVTAVRAYVAELPAHIEAERVKIRDAEPMWFGYRQTHTQRLEALLRLQSALAAQTPV